jgi:hypothetical protein
MPTAHGFTTAADAECAMHRVAIAADYARTRNLPDAAILARTYAEYEAEYLALWNAERVK